MKLLVCISKTPDTTSKISFDASNKHFIEEGVQYILNPYDEWYSLVKAIELKEKWGGEVHVIHVGLSTSDIFIRKTLAIGADAAFRIDDDPEGSQSVASQIASFAKDKSYDIVFVGKETIDFNSSEVGSKLAQYLDWPFISHCNSLDMELNKATCSYEIEGGIETVELTTPFVISAAKGLAEQRIPNMKGIIDAKKKPLEVLNKMGVENLIELVNFEMPPSKSGVQMINPENIDEMVRIFKNELKII